MIFAYEILCFVWKEKCQIKFKEVKIDGSAAKKHKMTFSVVVSFKNKTELIRDRP